MDVASSHFLLADLLVVTSLPCFSFLLLLSLFPIALHAHAAAGEAQEAEDEFDRRHDEEGIALGAVGELRVVVFEGKEWVLAPLHNGENNEEIDTDKGGECAVEAATREKCRHLINLYN